METETVSKWIKSRFLGWIDNRSQIPIHRIDGCTKAAAINLHLPFVWCWFESSPGNQTNPTLTCIHTLKCIHNPSCMTLVVAKKDIIPHLLLWIQEALEVLSQANRRSEGRQVIDTSVVLPQRPWCINMLPNLPPKNRQTQLPTSLSPCSFCPTHTSSSCTLDPSRMYRRHLEIYWGLRGVHLI